jgi:hypothetical protein
MEAKSGSFLWLRLRFQVHALVLYKTVNIYGIVYIYMLEISAQTFIL